MGLFVRYISVIVFVFLFNGQDNKVESKSEFSNSGFICNIEECVLREAQTSWQNLIDVFRGENLQAEYRCTSGVRGLQYIKHTHTFNALSHAFGSGVKECLGSITKRCDTISNSPVDYFIYRLHRIIV